MKQQLSTPLLRRLARGMFFLVLLLPARPVKAQTEEAQQLLLNVEKLAQLKSILQNMYEGYQVLQQGYNAVRDMAEGNFSLHKTFLDALREVSPAVRRYHRVAAIGSRQYALVQEYRKAWGSFKNHPSFTPEEVQYMDRVYQHLIRKSQQSLDQLVLVLTAGTLRMTDSERLAAIDRIHGEVEAQASFLKAFNRSTGRLALQRAHARNELEQIRKWHSPLQ